MEIEKTELNQGRQKNLFIILIISYFIIQTVSCSRSTIKHFNLSIEYYNQATRITNMGGSGELINPEDMDKIIEFTKKALVEAKLVDIRELNHRYPDFGNHFRDEFIRSLRLFIEGIEKNDNLKMLLGQNLQEKWGAWYDQNIEGIRRGKDRSQ
ncbi:MAG: hypothetical protein U9O50_08395 [Acidobacteriota bacterium]|nr:hypothetical protein [Acidobacteriota bacterium]